MNYGFKKLKPTFLLCDCLQWLDVYSRDTAKLKDSWLYADEFDAWK